jgi:hypothetical protein
VLIAFFFFVFSCSSENLSHPLSFSFQVQQKNGFSFSSTPNFLSISDPLSLHAYGLIVHQNFQI